MHTVAIVGAGSNLGARSAILGAARHHLAAQGVRTERRSHTYESPAMVPPGREPGPSFLNEAWRIRTGLSPRRLLALLLEVERRFGRVRDERWGDRTLDLDVLWMPHEVKLPELSVPHPGLRNRAFAIAPTLDVEPKLRHLLAGMPRPPTRLEPPARGSGQDSADALSAVLNAQFAEPVAGRVVRRLRATQEALPEAIAAAELVIGRIAVLDSPRKPGNSTWEVALVGTLGGAQPVC